MEFFSGEMTLVLQESHHSRYCCFAADVFKKRPDFGDIQKFQGWAEQLQVAITELVSKKQCPLAWMAFYMDKDGMLLLVENKDSKQLVHTRNALSTILKRLGTSTLPEDMGSAILDTLRPLDELDRDRIQSWDTMESLKPAPKVPVQLPTDRAPTAAEYADYCENAASSDEEGEQETMPTTLALRGSEVNVDTLASFTGGSKMRWVACSRDYATIACAATGPPPELKYVRISHEKRRQLLLISRLIGKCTMANMVKIAVGMVADGSIPGPGAHGRFSEFLRRCADAVKKRCS